MLRFVLFFISLVAISTTLSLGICALLGVN
jgi:hypothetical protein